MRLPGWPSQTSVAKVIVVRSSVVLTGVAVVAAASLGGLDVWSGTCAGAAVVLLAASSGLLKRWPNGPTVFLVAAVLQSATAPHPTIEQQVAMVVFIPGYLLIVDAAQSGRDSTDRRFWLPHLQPFVIGAALGATLAIVSTAPLTGSASISAVAAVVAGTAGAGLFALTPSGHERGRRTPNLPPG